MKKISFYIIAGAIIVTTSGCSKMLQSMYGMKPYRTVNNEDIIELASKYKIPAEKSFSIDTTYRTFLENFRKEYTSLRTDNHIHPLQAVYYDRNGVQNSFQSGVYAGNSLSNFLWNNERQFVKFPPRTSVPIDSMFSFSEHLSFVKTLDGKPLDAANYQQADYNVIVHWARFAGRQSQRLVKVVKRNYEKFGKAKKVNFFYVNTDNLYEGVN
jgi:hypothetical protein